MKKNRLSATTPLTTELIQKYLDADTAENGRKNKLYEYYVGKQDIIRRVMDDGKPNNKVVNPYANYITDIMTSYFMGEPVSYNSNEEELLSVIDAIFNYNDESAENAELAKDASIMGEAFECLYLDADKQIRFKNFSPIGCIPIYENTIEEPLLYLIRYYDEVNILNNSVKTIVEVYTRQEIIYYEKDTSQAGLTMVNQVPHNWGDIPIVDYYNNAESLGDFEPVMSEIDAYDILESDCINEMNYFADAYLLLKGMTGTTADDVKQIRDQRVLLVPTDGDATWLTKNQSDTYVENLKTRIDNNIHKFSKCPAMTDEDFASNASGVAMKYKLMGIENVASKKERNFKKGLQRRLELICNMLAVMGSAYDYRAIDIVFKRNIPSNLVEMADVVNKLGTIVSNETKFDLLPLDIDYETEKQRLQEEKESGYSIDFTTTETEDVSNGDEQELLETESVE